MSKKESLLIMAAIILVLLLVPLAFPGGSAGSSNSLLPHFPHARAATNNSPRATNCLGKGGTATAPFKLKIALVKPVFTATPYSQYEEGSFYAFYHKYGSVKKSNITTNLNWLNTTVSSGLGYNDGWGLSYSLYGFLNSQSAKNCGLVLGSNVFAISDINVTEGGLFLKNGSSRFNIIIVGFSEYVTSQEYYAYKQFVSNGGTLILMGASPFLVQVGFSASSNHEWLIKGHGWSFNGKTAWHGVGGAWEKDNINWLGSTFCCFRRFDYSKGAVPNQNNSIGASLQRMFGSRLFASYSSHEENGVRNMTDTSIIATFVNQSGTLVASYVHEYKRGGVVCFCVFGDDIISYDQSAQYFLILAASAAPTSPSPMQTMTTTGISTVVVSSITTASLTKSSTFSRSITNVIPAISRPSDLFFEISFFVAVTATAAIGLGLFVHNVKKNRRV